MKVGDMGGTCSMHGRKIKSVTVLLIKPEGGPKHRWEDNVKVDYQEIKYEDVD
jgi:hypothetical protein